MPIVSGYTTGQRTRTYPGAGGNTVPLLSSFYFAFNNENFLGEEKPDDNPILDIRILAGGAYTDLSPDAEKIEVANNRLLVGFGDQRIDDPTAPRYYYRVKHLLKPNAMAKRFQIRGDYYAGRGNHSMAIPAPPAFQHGGALMGSVFVLCGFKVRYRKPSNHKIKSIGIYEEAGRVHIELSDNSPYSEPPVSDLFEFVVDYAWVNRSGQRVRLGEENGLGRPIFNEILNHVKGEKLIRGFRFEFTEGEKEIHNFGITTSDAGMRIAFGDKNQIGNNNQAAPNYNYMIQWAEITPLAIMV